MQRRPPAVVATVQECRIPIQQVANALDIIVLRGHMDGMILCGRYWPAAPADLIEKPGDLFRAEPAHHWLRGRRESGLAQLFAGPGRGPRLR